MIIRVMRLLRRGVFAMGNRLQRLTERGSRASRRARLRHVAADRGATLAMAGLIGVAVLVGASAAFFHHGSMPATPVATSATPPLSPRELLASANMHQRFATLSQATTDSCAHLGNKPAIYAAMANMPPDSYLQGSCCSAMDFQHYRRQVAELRAYAGISTIPADPYNVPVALVESLLQDEQTIALTVSQQVIYDQAARMTDDHGWCCCQCWAWYAHAGLAKYLITAHGFSAAQAVAVMNLEDCCGGA